MRLVAGAETPVLFHWPALRLTDTHGAGAGAGHLSVSWEGLSPLGPPPLVHLAMSRDGLVLTAAVPGAGSWVS